jgi:hypothetical protein
MKYLNILSALMVSISLTACGGGGGSAGTAGAVAGAASTAAATAGGSIEMTLVDAAGVAVSDRSLSQTASRFVIVTFKDAKGAALPYERIELKASAGADLVTISPSSGALLTDITGVVSFKISPSSVVSSGAIAVTATGSVATKTITQSLNLQTSPGVVLLSGLLTMPASVQKGQAVNATVAVKVNGLVAPSNSVAVSFSSNCGTVFPVSALVDSLGNAAAVIQTTQSGSCNLSATATGGSNTVSGAFTVSNPPVASLRFVSATPEVIYQTGSPGKNTSLVKFRLVDTLDAPVQGQIVAASLSNTDGNINFCNGPVSGPTDSAGEITFSVCGGSLPTTVSVRGEVVGSSPLIFTNSNKLTIQTGLPTQRFFDISTSAHNFYVGAFATSLLSGKTTDINVFMADRQGNPVPDGTSVVFVAEGGQLNTGGNSSCVLTAGGCKVQLIGQDYRPLGSAASGGDPRPGRVTVLAYTDGEESFVDTNQNNRHDAGELFEDLGTPYIDKDENLGFLANYKNLQIDTDEGEQAFPLPNGVAGTSACPLNSNLGLSVLNTCNGVWDRLTKVRRSIVIVFSGGEIGQPGSYHASIPDAKQTAVLFKGLSGVQVRLADLNGNPLPSDAAVAVEVIDPDQSGCTAKMLGSVIGSTTEPTTHAATLETCNGDETVQFKVTVGTKISSLSVRLQ